MLFVISIVLYIIGDILGAIAKDNERRDRESERRYMEIMETKNTTKKKVVRRVLRDVDGRYAVEEIEEWG